MIALAMHTARARASSLAGSFIALALGVGLLSGMALTLASTIGAGNEPPRWYVNARTVIAGTDSVSITTGSGEDRETETQRSSESRAVPAELSTVDQTAIVDYAGYASADGAPGDTAHPWSSAALHDYAWVAGGAPHGDGEVVLTAPTALHPGDTVTLHTREGPKPFTVSGVLSTAAQPAFYVTDAKAKELAGVPNRTRTRTSSSSRCPCWAPRAGWPGSSPCSWSPVPSGTRWPRGAASSD